MSIIGIKEEGDKKLNRKIKFEKIWDAKSTQSRVNINNEVQQSKVELLKPKDKEHLLKTKKNVMLCIEINDFLPGSMEKRKQWNAVF